MACYFLQTTNMLTRWCTRLITILLSWLSLISVDFFFNFKNLFFFFIVDDKIDFDEFALMMDTYEQIQVEEMMLQTFRVVDQDGDGFISAQELQSAMSDMGENVTEEEVKTMIESADLDLDGQINFKGKISS